MKTTKKLLAILLAVLMMMSFASTVSAFYQTVQTTVCPKSKTGKHEVAYSIEVTKQSTLTEDGEGEGECFYCKEMCKIVVPKEEHTWGDFMFDEYVGAPCYIMDVKEKRVCTKCGEVSYRIVRLPDWPEVMQEHTWVEYTEVKATCTTDGSRWYVKCSVCERVEKGVEEVIPATGHNYVLTEERQVSCTEDGYSLYKCVNDGCGHSYKENVVKALTHTDNNKDGKCDNCGANNNELIENCGHICHEDGFKGFIWKIVRFFWKLFKMNPKCECGMAHY